MAKSSSAEVDGRRSILMGSDMAYEFLCSPCEKDGKYMEASGYCLDCPMYLCDPCMKYHKNLPPLAHHQILDKDNMPKKQHTPEVSDVCTERCQIHRDEIIKYFCTIHEVLGCTVCVTLKHNRCEDVSYIPEVVPGLENSTDYKEFMAKLDELTQKSKDATKFATESKKRSSDCSSKALKKIDAYRKEVVGAIDKQVDDIKQQVRQKTAQDTKTMDSLADKSNKVLGKLQSLSSNLSSLQSKQQLCKMFVELKSKEEYVRKLQEELEGMDNADVTDFEFQPDDELRSVIGQNGLGKLLLKSSKKAPPQPRRQSPPANQPKKPDVPVLPPKLPKNPEKISVKHVKDINMKAKSNSKACMVSGVAPLSANKLVAVDWQNESIKLVDTESGKILSELKPKTPPWHVARVDNTHAAVTLYSGKKILLLKHEANNGLIIEKEMKVNTECLGIASTSDKLVVSFKYPAELRVWKMNGNKVQRFAMAGQGEKFFSGTGHITASDWSVCVSDWKQKCVTVMDEGGKVKAVYQDDDLANPRQLAMDNTGMIYLCDGDSNSVHLLTPDCRKVKLLLKEADGIKDPESICYCEATGRLYVGMWNSNVVKVYKLSY